MVGDLYIFVDESGHHARGKYYTVASCWCVSEQAPQHVLDNARARLSSHVADVCGFSDVGEIKGTKLPKDRLGSFLRILENFAYEDGTIADPPYPWQQNKPFRCAHHSFNPELGTQILADYVSEPDAPRILQRLALARILSPLTDANVVDLTQIGEIHLIPDAEVWATPANKVCSLLSDINGPEIEVETRKSHRTPGVQIADVLAYSWRSYTKDGSCEDAADYVAEIRL